jgi:hypothetical protein
LAVGQFVPSALSLPFVATYHVAAVALWASAQTQTTTGMNLLSFI